MPILHAAALLLADGRLPTGGHAHSGGVETAVATGVVRTIDELREFCRGRLHTTGSTAAGLAAAAASGADLAHLDAEADARTPSPALRSISRRLGRQMLRTARHLWWSERLAAAARTPDGPHHPVVLGCLSAAAELTPREAALLAAVDSITTPATAALRLLGLDPFQVSGVLAELSGAADAVADNAAMLVAAGTLPSGAAPLLEVYAEQHATLEVHLFAS
ncbi:urease accessory protein UreF [Saccharopolyspora spinosa]|uniref:Urease accessory protein UreF n=1 Tax=Saccharopolyspora spinosa TaxID=60894 RepID=Q6JHP3_SACSN|nr:urease accessory UreF family protein [Saccharopolyspora spinosa]AAS00414.1 urease accessory protein, UreF family [Saccharopolyspora spinosa NRRL 18395]PKW16134.1 urease accessory protein [Saccharopolyspora spinosa]